MRDGLYRSLVTPEKARKIVSQLDESLTPITLTSPAEESRASILHESLMLRAPKTLKMKKRNTNNPRQINFAIEKARFPFIFGTNPDAPSSEDRMDAFGALRWFQIHSRIDDKLIDEKLLEETLNEISYDVIHSAFENFPRHAHEKIRRFYVSERQRIQSYFLRLQKSDTYDPHNFILEQPSDSCGPWSAFNIVYQTLWESFDDNSWVIQVIKHILPRSHRQPGDNMALDMDFSEQGMLQRYSEIQNIVDTLGRERSLTWRKAWHNAYGASFLAMILTYSKNAVNIYLDKLFSTSPQEKILLRSYNEDGIVEKQLEYVFYISAKTRGAPIRETLFNVVNHIENVRMQVNGEKVVFRGAIILFQVDETTNHYVAAVPRYDKLIIIDPMESEMMDVNTFWKKQESDEKKGVPYYKQLSDCPLYAVVYQKKAM